MPRVAREKSRTGVYHIMMRGVNRQQVFEENEDYIFFVEQLRKYKERTGFELYAYCLMNNHVHLLIKEERTAVSEIIRLVGGGYALWYNTKYDRVGHVFQSRFRSESVITPGSLLRVARYIHQNPIKAGLCSCAEEYFFSSYNEYLADNLVVEPGITDVYMVLKFIGLKDFIRYNNAVNDDKCLDLETNVTRRHTEDRAKELIRELSGCSTVAEFQRLSIGVRRDCLKNLRAQGLSVRQLSRLTGESRGVIQRMSA